MSIGFYTNQPTEFPKELSTKLKSYLSEGGNFDQKIKALFLSNKSVHESFNAWAAEHELAKANPLINRIKKLSNEIDLQENSKSPIFSTSDQSNNKSLLEFSSTLEEYLQIPSDQLILEDKNSLDSVLPFLQKMENKERINLFSAEKIADGLEARYFRSSWVFNKDTQKEYRLEYFNECELEFKERVLLFCDPPKALELVNIFVTRLKDKEDDFSIARNQTNYLNIIKMTVSSMDESGRTYIYQSLLSQDLANSNNDYVKNLIRILLVNDESYNFLDFVSVKGEFEGKGQGVIVEHLQEKGSLPKGKVSICNNLTELSERLLEISRDPFADEHYFLLALGHTTPLSIRRIDGEWEAIITDSTAKEDNLSQICQLLNENLSTKAIYSSTLLRQKDRYACGVFSIRDLVQIFKHGKTTFEFFREQSKETQNVLKRVGDLPVYLLKITQYETQLDPYLKADTSSGDEASVRTKKIADGLKKHIVNEQNKVIESRAEKYTQIIIRKLIRERS